MKSNQKERQPLTNSPSIAVDMKHQQLHTSNVSLLLFVDFQMEIETWYLIIGNVKKTVESLEHPFALYFWDFF